MVASLWSMIANQFAPDNLFQTICFLLILMISLPSLMLDRIVRVFETHRRLRMKDILRVTAGDESSEQADLEQLLADYSGLKFVQKRAHVLSPEQLPTPHLTFFLRSGEVLAVYLSGAEIDITRMDKSGRAVVTYWVRGAAMFARLQKLAESLPSSHSEVASSASASSR